ncbi:MAG: hypothetical protein RJB38_2061 [Pseudomonadota bacterium]|jgi:hypothetical protein
MNFTRKKLPLDRAKEMRVCPVDSLQACVPLPAPLYALLSTNQKFLAIKAPMDFLTEDDLEKASKFEALYFPPFIEQVIPYRRAGKSALWLLEGLKSGEGLRPAPFEVSDAWVQMTAPLWSGEGLIEPFFVSVFVSEVCGAFPGDLMKAVHDRDLEAYEQAVMKSSWIVWQALHLDFFDLDWLQALRRGVFEACGMGGRYRGPDIGEDWIRNVLLSEMPLHPITLTDFSGASVRTKLDSRMRRLRRELIDSKQVLPSILGESGFLEVAG